MPARPVYFQRIEEGIAYLNSLTTEWVDRRNLEEAFGVSKTVAWRIMRLYGGSSGPGNALVCRREDLVRALENRADSSAVRQEVKRRARLEERLEQLARSAVSARVEVARGREAAELLDAKLAGLPAGVELSPGQLSIHFEGIQDFLRKFGAVVFALQNDYAAIALLLDTSKMYDL